MLRFFIILYFFLSLTLFSFGAGVSYSVDFKGVSDSALLKELKGVASLTTLKKKPPASLNALRYRADSDIPELLKVMHAYGYYDASVRIDLETTQKKAEVIVEIDPGPVYTIEDYTIRLYNGNFENPIKCRKITLERIGITLEKPALARSIMQAELKVLLILSEYGYPLAVIDKREILVDSESKTMHLNLEIDTGPLARFGETTVSSEGEVSPEFISQKITWEEGEIYDSEHVDVTQKKLMESGLFTSVLVTHDNALDEEGFLTMNIEVAESKHRSLNFGASYQTFYGPGFTFGWEHRNVGGMGRKLSLQGDITRRSHTGVATYLIPGFYRPNQDYVIQAEADHESITPYSERSYSLVNRVERRVGKHFRVTGGVMLEQLFVTESAANSTSFLFELPFYLRWSSANDLLNPTTGMTFEYLTTPTINFQHSNTYYLMQECSQSVYYSLVHKGIIVLAQKLTLGSILSNELSAIPLPKRFLGGSEEELRGYRYRTVSPLNNNNQPLGGRSAIYYTAEIRFRVFESMGLVPFFDLGNVQFNRFPTVSGKWFKSAGLGFRYFSFFGPIRVDLAFPLDRRKDLDPAYRFLVSIGQTF